MRLFDTEFSNTITRILKSDATKAGLAGLGLFAYYLFTNSNDGATKCNRNVTNNGTFGYQISIPKPTDLFQSSVYNLYLSSRGITSSYDKTNVAVMIYKKVAEGKDLTDEDKMYAMDMLMKMANEVSSSYDKSRIAGYINKIS